MSKPPPPKMPPDPAAGWRFRQIDKQAPHLIPRGGTVDGKELLYIGANPTRAQFLQELHVAGYKITVLEVFPAYEKWLRNHPWIADVIIGNVLDLQSLAWPWDNPWSVTWWWHGPEHVPAVDLSRALGGIERHTTDLVVIGCPWGRLVQGEVDGNPHQRHVSEPEPSWFADRGYQVHASGSSGGGHFSDHILAWKYLNR